VIEAKKTKCAEALMIVKHFCKEFGFTDGILRGALAEGKKQKEK
tara:strand:- start:237 stop:368 length:132 start_codon:yes stop_codon:yes gene_type:complete